jgi:hypothetical protein
MIASTLLAIPFVPVFSIVIQNLAARFDKRKYAPAPRDAESL